ncbi:hypothetical protein Glove_149g41 [Diversispora epigaea]|uniref:Uncharacterized protein n=1 Tax=Diversispora epigaea TaxID=1348612 RepID=A0A397ITI5_9GLOM|nr:hypothetical protein Glove_149g41 [Diversispora epigaea]
MARSLPIDIPVPPNFDYEDINNIKAGWNHLIMLPSPLEDSEEVWVESPCALGGIKLIKAKLWRYYPYGKDLWPYDQSLPGRKNGINTLPEGKRKGRGIEGVEQERV